MGSALSKLRRGIGRALAVTAVLGAAIMIFLPRLPMAYQARQVVDRFILAVNHNRPQDIYPLLTPEIRKTIDRNGFIENFTHERSYPYLTPLFLYVDRIEFSGDNKKGRVFCTVAARLPGEKKEYEVVYVPFKGYRMNALRAIADGSYIWRFERLKKGRAGRAGSSGSEPER